MADFKEVFIGREPFVGPDWDKKGFLADDATVEKQACPNFRCRGNVSSHCAYSSFQYNICGDKGAANTEFFTCD